MQRVTPTSGYPLFQALERKLTNEPALQLRSILHRAAVSLPAFTQALEARERELGIATLPTATLLRLFSLYQQYVCADLGEAVLWHQPSLRASEKAALLPEHFVQKSVTVQFGDSIVLCSGLGDFTLSNRLLRQVSLTLGLHNRVQSRRHINPPAYPSEFLYGILEGMVSPFLHPDRVRGLLAVVFLTPPTGAADEARQVAISLSPFESLAVPLGSFQSLLYAYAGAVYPGRWIAIADDTGDGAPTEERLALAV
jgi:hypothetical protein